MYILFEDIYSGNMLMVHFKRVKSTPNNDVIINISGKLEPDISNFLGLCQLREGAKTPLRGGVLNSARPSAAHMYPPHFSGHPSTLPPFLSALVYTPPIFEVDRLHPPHFGARPSTPPPKYFSRIIYMLFATFLMHQN